LEGVKQGDQRPMIFKIFFAETLSAKNGVFDSKQIQILKKFDHNIGI
jgi:hypothetical protein